MIKLTHISLSAFDGYLGRIIWFDFPSSSFGAKTSVTDEDECRCYLEDHPDKILWKR